jgi:coproporphyrinogen III oxidase-like Fe-S oxidoreductase
MLADILEAVDEGAGLAPGAEVTVECNPETVTAAKLSAYRAAGVTRLSFGVQSMVPHVLASLGREHDPASVRRAVALAGEAGFAGAFSVDLIFGAVGESPADWEASLEGVLGLDPPPAHVSAYALTVEPGTPLARDPARHPDDDVLARRYETADAVLADAGYEWEEISNWARPGHGCAHNRLYWRQGDYRGFGSAAHSHRAGTRSWNVRTPERYIEALESGASAVAGTEELTGDQRAFEALALALRTPAGVPDDALPEDPVLSGLVTRRAGRAVLTVRGRLLANELTTRLVAPSSTAAR